jgi:arylsulfatase A-like enzyme
VRKGDWKLVATAKGAWELYDLRQDRAEQNNLADAMPDKVNQLADLWQRNTDLFTRQARSD